MAAEPVSETLAASASLPAAERWRERVNAAARLQQEGRLGDAEALLRPTIDEARRPPPGVPADRVSEALAAALVNQATVLAARGGVASLDEADRLLGEAERHARSLGGGVRLGTVSLNRAFVAGLRGDVRRARPALAEAERHYRAAGALSDLAWALRARGSQLADAGQLREALPLQQRARSIFVAEDEPEQADMTEIGLVAIRHQLEERIDADERRRLREVAARLPPEPAIQLLGNLGNIAMADDLEAAETLWRAARDRSRAEGRELAEQRAELSLASVERRRGDVLAALGRTESARAALSRLGAWDAVARADVNRALALEDLAMREEADTARRAALRRDAASAAVAAVGALDRLRHALPGAVERRALLEHRYPQLFTVALGAAMRAGDAALLAALAERARVQPALAGDGQSFRDPRPVRARPGGITVPGDGSPVTLTEHAEGLAGRGARWLSWWRADADLLRIGVGGATGAGADADAVAPPERQLSALARWLARPTLDDHARANGDAAQATRLALWRAAVAPLLRDDHLAAQLATTMPHRVRRTMAAEIERLRATSLDDVLLPLARALLGEPLLAELAARPRGEPARLVLAPIRALADVPWPMLPLRSAEPGERPADVPRLLDVADLALALPTSLVTVPDVRPATGGTLAVLDPLGDLTRARHVAPSARRLGSTAPEPATRATFAVALREPLRTLVLAAHVRPGTPARPDSAALMLRGDGGRPDPLTARELAAHGVPPVCVVLGCDGSGAGASDEWTGLATGLVWAGARWVITSTWPTLEDAPTAHGDTKLVAAVERDGAPEGLRTWQRARMADWRVSPDDPATAPYRWAGTVLTGPAPALVTGSGTS